jgi:hypothetical protein
MESVSINKMAALSISACTSVSSDIMRDLRERACRSNCPHGN